MKNAFFFSSGTLQTDRALDALLPTYIAVDEKTDADYLNFLFDFSDLIRFWNSLNDAQGTWQQFLDDDLSFLLAGIMRSDISGYPLRFHQLIKAYSDTAINSEKERALVQLLLLNISIAERIYTWYDSIQIQSERHPENTGIESAAIELLQANLWKGAHFISSCYKSMFYFFSQSPNWLAGKNVEVLANKTQHYLNAILAWSPGEKQDLEELSPSDLHINFNSYQGFQDYLVRLYESAYGSAYLMQKQAAVFLQESLGQSNHAPQVTLLLTLREIMGPVRQLLNTFTQKHLDFYYKSVLLQEEAPPVPDQVPVQFQLNPAHEQSFHPAGTALIAGSTAAGKPIVYKTTKALKISPAKPVVFKTIYNGTQVKDIASAVEGRVLASPVANSGDGKGGKGKQLLLSWPTLGASTDASLTANNLAQLGFAIATPLLFLSDGVRTIRVYLEMGEASMQALQSQLVKLGLPQRMSAFFSFLEQSFQLSLTTEKGWLQPQGTQVTAFSHLPSFETGTGDSETGTGSPINYKAAHGLLFTLTLADDEPALAAYNEKVHGPGFGATTPILRFVLQQEVPLADKTINPYPLLTSLKLQHVFVEAEAAEVRNFVAQNDFSVLKPQRPFPPFGVKPVLGSNFYLGSNEIFFKHLSQLSLEIEWYDLPLFPYGFCDYYEAYNRFNPDKPFYNSVFQWQADILLDKKWVPLSMRQLVPPTGETGETGTGSMPSAPIPVIHKSIVSRVKQPDPPKIAPPVDPAFENLAHGILGKILDVRKLLFEHKKILESAPPEPPSPIALPKSEPEKSFFTTPIFEWETLQAKAPVKSSAKATAKAKNEGMHHILDSLEGLLGHLKDAVFTGDNNETGIGTGDSGSSKLSEIEKQLEGKLGSVGGASSSTATTSITPDASSSETGAEEDLPLTEEAEQAFCKQLNEGKLRPVSVFEFDVDMLSWNSTEQPSLFSDKTKFSDQTKGGFLRFTLKQPSYAFGQADYARVLSEVANRNMEIIAGQVGPKHGGDTGAADLKKTVPPQQHHSSLLWNIFDGVAGVISSFVPVVGMIKKGIDEVHSSKILENAQKLLAEHKKAEETQEVKKEAKLEAEENKLILPPRPAYIPKIKEVVARYSAIDERNFAQSTSDENADLQLFHLHPFGVVEEQAALRGANMLPIYSSQGYLYIGLEKVNAPQELSLLFVLNEASGNRNEEPPKIEWSFFDGQQWAAFSPLAVQDGTNGFVQSGVIEFQLTPAKKGLDDLFATQQKPAASQLYWIRARAAEHATAVCETVGVLPHAVVAAFAGGQSQSDHLKEPLPAGKIDKLQQAHPKVAKVVQPVASSGGKASEEAADFYTRVQERLRHKDRAVSSWDYERLVLQQFSEIGLARCLNHTSTTAATGLKPGAALVLVLPAKVSKNEDALAPKTNQGILKKVRYYLETVTDPFVQIEVKNPEYRFIKVSASIQFVPGVDTGHCLNVLNEGLVELIAPWKVNIEAVNPFEYQCNYFTLLEYLHQQSFVEQVYAFSLVLMETAKDKQGKALPESFEPFQVEKPWELISSVGKHSLEVAYGAVSPDIKLEESLQKLEEAKSEKPLQPIAFETGETGEERETGETGEVEAVADELLDEIGRGNALFIRNDWYRRW